MLTAPSLFVSCVCVCLSDELFFTLQFLLRRNLYKYRISLPIIIVRLSIESANEPSACFFFLPKKFIMKSSKVSDNQYETIQHTCNFYFLSYTHFQIEFLFVFNYFQLLFLFTHSFCIELKRRE